uniref:Uncharacterized protein n=1 Tax=Avena sativa TaxID=4498 RepID=A0ACD5WZS4_AVESA
MAMALLRLLRGLAAPLSPSDWLPCNQPLSSFSASLLRNQWWLPMLAALPRLRCPSCSDGFKLLLVLLLVSAALAEVRFVASSSMAPTLHPGDRALAEKVTYLFRRPSVGDIVFFRVPTALQDCGMSKDTVFIKRVLATPGDFIEVRQGQLIVNGVARKEHYTATHTTYTMEAMVCCVSFLSVSIVSLNNIEELLLPGQEIVPKLLVGLHKLTIPLQEDDRMWHGCSVLLTSRVPCCCNQQASDATP